MDGEVGEEKKGYSTFGEFTFYKQHILAYMFQITSKFCELPSELPEMQRHKVAAIVERKEFIDALRAFVILLAPKIDKLNTKDEKGKSLYESLKTFIEEEWTLETYGDYKKILKLYAKTVALVEELGYSDMSMKKDEDHNVEW